MKRPLDEPLDDLHGELTDRLAGTYRAQREEPPPMLDDLILAKAKRAAQQRRVARLRALGASFGVAATLVLGLALTLQVITMPKPIELPDESAELMTKEKAAAEPTDRLLQRSEVLPVSPAPQLAPPTRAAMELRSMDAARPVAAGSAVAAPPALSAPPSSASREDTAETRARIAAELYGEQASKSEQLDRLEVTGARVKRTQLEAAHAVAPRALDEWLAEVERLERDGKSVEAAAMLAELCAVYPTARRCATK